MNVSFSSLILSKSGVPFYTSSFSTQIRTTRFSSCRFSRFWNPSLYISDRFLNLKCFKSEFKDFLSSAVYFSDKDAVVNNTDKFYYTGKKFFYDSGPNTFHKCTFCDCNANGNGNHFDSGGAIQALFSNEDVAAPIFYLKLSHCGFFNCTAKNTGGAISVHTVKINTKFCLFKNCSSNNGGAFFSNNCTEELVSVNDTFISGLSVRKHVERSFGMAFDQSKIFLNHINMSRINEEKIHGPLVNGFEVPEFKMQYSWIDHCKGLSLINIQDGKAKEMIIQYMVFKVCEGTNGIVFVNKSLEPVKCRDMVFIRCGGQCFGTNDTSRYIVDNCYIAQLKNEQSDDEAKYLRTLLVNFKNFKVAEPNFKISYPKISDWYYVMNHDPKMITVSKPFTPSVTFLPTRPFTPSMTLSGIMFVRNGQKWYEFRRSVHTVTTVNLESLFSYIEDIL